MASNFQPKYEWYIVTVISGKETATASNIEERIGTYGYLNMVSNIQIIRREKEEATIYNKNDSSLPKSLKDTKISKWETLEDGNYKKITTKVANKFPGYVFIRMVYDKDLWHVIRNTKNVLGLIGSTGSGAKPIPVSEAQYQNSLKQINNEKVFVEEIITHSIKAGSNEILATPAVKYNFAVGDSVEIENGKFINNSGKIIAIDAQEGTATVEISESDTTINLEVSLSDLKK
ncbi:MAG: transcription termination/antitermination protein NusG [Mycoplasmataceae bacterium]|nr:transcription termination/antitermination protein NusG [Mycoplasmataceae bacterium]